METITEKYYYVMYENQGGHFGNEGYSKYYENKRKYGHKDALAHIEELRDHKYEGKQIYKDKKFFVVCETRVISYFPVTKNLTH